VDGAACAAALAPTDNREFAADPGVCAARSAGQAEPRELCSLCCLFVVECLPRPLRSRPMTWPWQRAAAVWQSGGAAGAEVRPGPAVAAAAAGGGLGSGGSWGGGGASHCEHLIRTATGAHCHKEESPTPTAPPPTHSPSPPAVGVRPPRSHTTHGRERAPAGPSPASPPQPYLPPVGDSLQPCTALRAPLRG